VSGLSQKLSTASYDGTMAQYRGLAKWVAVCGLGLLMVSGCTGESSDIGIEEPSGNLPDVVVTETPVPPVSPLPGPTDDPMTNPGPLAAPGTLAAGEQLFPWHLRTDKAEPYFTVEPITDEIFERMNGKSWREGAIPISELRYLRVLYWAFGSGPITGPESFRDTLDNHGTFVGEIIVNEAIADDVLDIFKELYLEQYPIGLMVLIDNFDADDTLSMNTNNTSGFNHRFIAGTTTLSNHSRGMAIDLNPVQNPWVSGGNVEPQIGAPYADRADIRPGMITHDDLAYQLFKAHGFSWGGDWRSPKDYQHFEKS